MKNETFWNVPYLPVDTYSTIIRLCSSGDTLSSVSLALITSNAVEAQPFQVSQRLCPMQACPRQSTCLLSRIYRRKDDSDALR